MTIKKAILFSLIVFSVLQSGAQSKSLAYLYTQQTGNKENFQYSIEARFSNGAFQTIYKLFKPGSSKPRYTVTASHYKILKKIIVDVIDEQYLLSVIDGREETEYGNETLQPFGIRGDMAIFDKSEPNQLAVQFVSSRYEYVRLINFLCSSSDGIFQYFIFRKEDKIIEPKLNSTQEKQPKAIFRPTNSKDSTSIWFVGTKSFCDKDKVWKYEVTIKGDSIILKLFAGSGNTYYKNKSAIRETVKGYIKGVKIITRDSREYIEGRFKYEAGVLYELNNEGDYNAYGECK